MTRTALLGDAAPAGRDARLAGVLFVLAAVACFSGIDTGSKAIGAMPVAVVIWFRYAVQAAVTGATLLPRRGRALLATRRPRLHVLRGTLLLLTSVFSFLSLRVMPVGEFTAILMLTPIVMTVVSVLAFGERVPPARWALIALAFCGGLLVIRPGTGAPSVAMILPFVALALNTGFHLATSRLALTDDAGTMQFHTGCIGTLLATLALPFVDLPAAPAGVWLVLALVCACSTAGHAMLIVGYAKAGVATLTPLLFAQIAFGTLFGWLVFSHVPDAPSLAGIALIAIGGAACTWLSARERAGTERARAEAELLASVLPDH